MGICCPKSKRTRRPNTQIQPWETESNQIQFSTHRTKNTAEYRPEQSLPQTNQTNPSITNFGKKSFFSSKKNSRSIQVGGGPSETKMIQTDDQLLLDYLIKKRVEFNKLSSIFNLPQNDQKDPYQRPPKSNNYDSPSTSNFQRKFDSKNFRENYSEMGRYRKLW